MSRWTCGIFVGFFLIAACAGPQRQAAEIRASDARSPAVTKRITAAIRGNPPTVSMDVNTAGGTGHIAGGDELEELLNTRPGMVGNDGVLRPQLAESVPSVESGSWRVRPDGRMETTWKIRSTARWHDGTPFTAADLVFSYQVEEDREIAAFRDADYKSVDRMEAPDPLTLVVFWKEPYIFANNIFRASVLPKHLLEGPFLSDKETFTDLPFWKEDFVGTGAFKLRQWATGSHAVLVAFDDYVMGRPKIDEITVRFIPDGNTLLANVLAGEIDVTMGLGISLDQALEAREHWAAGRAEVVLSGWVAVHPYLLNPVPEVVGDVRFRRALVHALDRQAMADTLQAGYASVAHSFVSPNQPEYTDVDPHVVRYEYDQRKASQMIAELGYTRGPDGIFRDAANQRLSVALRSIGGFDINEKSLFPIADYWQRAGVAVEPSIVTRAQATDLRFRATFPGFEMTRGPNYLSRFAIYHSSQMRLPENNYVGSNYMNYRNAEWDALIDRVFSTIPTRERNQALGQLMHHMTDRVIIIGTMYDLELYLIANRLQNATGANSPVRAPQTWNVHEWDLK